MAFNSSKDKVSASGAVSSSSEPQLVLLVDDDVSTRESFHLLLESLGYAVVTAENGRQALSLLGTQGTLPSVILLDLMMPVMSGWEFLEERAKDPRISSIPVVVMSAALDASAALPSVAGYVKKPVLPEQLFSLLDRFRSGFDVPTHSHTSQETGGTRKSPYTADAISSGELPTDFERRPLRVLLLQDNSDDGLDVTALLKSGEDDQFAIRRSKTLTERLTKEALAETDVILLNVDFTGDSSSGPLQKTARYAPGIPFVVLTRAESAELRQEALRWGAQDVLSKRLQTPELLGRSLHYAVERHRLRSQLELAREIAAYERERRGLAQIAQPRMSISAEMLGQSPLKQVSPERVQAFVEQFIAICEGAIKEREYELEATRQRQDLQKLADALAGLRAGPGDIVDIYQDALTQAWRDDHSELGSAKREEARLMLIALLGYVLAFYRLHVGTDEGPRSIN
jgi:CheY-like chemotaxis protein